MADALPPDDPDSTLSAEELRAIDAVCSRFEAAWKRGGAFVPRIESFIGDVPEAL